MDLLYELDLGYHTYGWSVCGRAAEEIRKLRAQILQHSEVCKESAWPLGEPALRNVARCTDCTYAVREKENGTLTDLLCFGRCVGCNAEAKRRGFWPYDEKPRPTTPDKG